MAQIKITLTKSPIGRKPEQRKTVAALGLGKLLKKTTLLSVVWSTQYLTW